MINSTCYGSPFSERSDELGVSSLTSTIVELKLFWLRAGGVTSREEVGGDGDTFIFSHISSNVFFSSPMRSCSFDILLVLSSWVMESFFSSLDYCWLLIVSKDGYLILSLCFGKSSSSVLLWTICFYFGNESFCLLMLTVWKDLFT